MFTSAWLAGRGSVGEARWAIAIGACLDIRMPPTHTTEGLDAAFGLLTDTDGPAVVLVSQYVEPDAAAELVANTERGFGYLLKERISDVDEFAATVRRVAAGETVIEPDVVRLMVRRQRIDNPIHRLTPREAEVLAAMAEGRSNSGIAAALSLNAKGVRG